MQTTFFKLIYRTHSRSSISFFRLFQSISRKIGIRLFHFKSQKQSLHDRFHLYLFSMAKNHFPSSFAKTTSPPLVFPHSQPSPDVVYVSNVAEHTVSLLSHRIAVPPTRITKFLRVVKRDELSWRRRNAIIEFKKWWWK